MYGCTHLSKIILKPIAVCFCCSFFRGEFSLSKNMRNLSSHLIAFKCLFSGFCFPPKISLGFPVGPDLVTSRQPTDSPSEMRKSKQLHPTVGKSLLYGGGGAASSSVGETPKLGMRPRCSGGGVSSSIKGTASSATRGGSGFKAPAVKATPPEVPDKLTVAGTNERPQATIGHQLSTPPCPVAKDDEAHQYRLFPRAMSGAGEREEDQLQAQWDDDDFYDPLHEEALTHSRRLKQVQQQHGTATTATTRRVSAGSGSGACASDVALGSIGDASSLLHPSGDAMLVGGQQGRRLNADYYRVAQ